MLSNVRFADTGRLIVREGLGHNALPQPAMATRRGGGLLPSPSQLPS
jgi:hypothetical protein